MPESTVKPITDVQKWGDSKGFFQHRCFSQIGKNNNTIFMKRNID